MIQRCYTIARNTFLETVRQPIYGVILLATALLMVLNVSLAAFTLEDDNKLLLDLGLSTLLLSGLFLSAFSATGVLSREIEDKTVLTVISKPVGRPVFILGKYLGLLAALVLSCFLASLAFLLCLRHGVLQTATDPWDLPVLTLGGGSVILATVAACFANYFYDRDFMTTVLAVATPLLVAAVVLTGFFDAQFNRVPFASRYAGVGGTTDIVQVLLACFLVFLTVVVIAAVAVAASTRFGQLMTLLICTVALGVGIISDYAFGQYADSSLLASVVYRVVPNIGPFWVIDGLHAGMQETSITAAYVLYVAGYAALLASAILCLAIVAFQKREVG